MGQSGSGELHESSSTERERRNNCERSVSLAKKGANNTYGCIPQIPRNFTHIEEHTVENVD